MQTYSRRSTRIEFEGQTGTSGHSTMSGSGGFASDLLRILVALSTIAVTPPLIVAHYRLHAEEVNALRPPIAIIESDDPIEIHKNTYFKPDNSGLFSSESVRDDSSSATDSRDSIQIPEVTIIDPTSERIAGWSADRAALDAETARDRLKVSIIEGFATALETAEDQLQKTKKVVTESRRELKADAERIYVATKSDYLEAQRLSETLKRRIAEHRKAEAVAQADVIIGPYRGPQGTWQRPIVLECDVDGLRIRPGEKSFSFHEIAASATNRASRLALEVRRSLKAAEQAAEANDLEMEPYLLFLVRPDGVRTYYEARRRLSTLDARFGYEFVDDSETVHYQGSDPEMIVDTSPTADGTPLNRFGSPPRVGQGGTARSASPSQPGIRVDEPRRLDDEIWTQIRSPRPVEERPR